MSNNVDTKMNAFPFEMNNVLLTRRCNLSCSYCRIVKDYDGMPYKSVNEYNEVPYTEWAKFGEWIKHNGDGFIILYGGEPFMYEDLEKLLIEYNKMDVAYTVITNSTRRKEALDLVKRGIIRGLSSSVDPTIFQDEKSNDKSRLLKSSKGLELLIEAKKLYPELDAVAEVVLDNRNYKYARKLVEMLSEHGIWSDITIIESSKNKYYDFAEKCDDLLLNEEQREELKDIILKMVEDKLLVHTPEAILNILPYGDSAFCTINKLYHTSTIDPDGSIRLCLRVRGLETPNYNIFELIDKGYNAKEVSDLLMDAINKDYDKCCEGCGWTCIHQYLGGIDSIKHTT